VLRHENAVLRRNAGRVRYEPGDRAWFAALMRSIPRRRWAEVFPVTPATLLAWHRRLAARKYYTSKRRQPGRPATVRSIARLALTLAADRGGYRLRSGATHMRTDTATVSQLLRHQFAFLTESLRARTRCRFLSWMCVRLPSGIARRGAVWAVWSGQGSYGCRCPSAGRRRRFVAGRREAPEQPMARGTRCMAGPDPDDSAATGEGRDESGTLWYGNLVRY
jgi:hypothetical protein